MSERYSIDPTLLTQTASRIQAQSAEILEQIGAVKQEVAGTHAFWTGRANLQYEALMAEWDRTAQAVQQSLQHTVEALTKAAADYGTTEQVNTALFAGA